MKRATTFRRLKSLKRIDRPVHSLRPGKRADIRSWERARYERAPEMIGHMLHVR